MLVISGLVESLAEVLIHDPGDLSDVVGVEDHIPGQVLRAPVQLVLAVALPAHPHVNYNYRHCPLELETKIKRRFAKNSKSQRRPLILVESYFYTSALIFDTLLLDTMLNRC